MHGRHRFAHCSPLAGLTRALVWSVPLILLSACGATAGREPSASGSRPLDELRRAQATADAVAEIPSGDAALDQWLQRVRESGLVKAPGGTARPPESRRPAQPDAESVPVESTGTPDPQPANAQAPVVLPTVAATIEPITPEPHAPAPAPRAPLAELMSLPPDGEPDPQRVAGLEAQLTPSEREFYHAWKELRSRIAAGTATGTDSADLAALKQAAADFAQRARSWSDLRVSRATLCTRVRGFGLYDELHRVSDTFKLLAGRKNTVIVYCELEGFTASRSGAAGAEGFTVNLSQELTLYAASRDRDMVAWRKDPQDISDFSRNPRRDFFVVQVIDLPATLSVGGYTLKVRVRDKGSTAGAEAEAVIPIDVVADNSAMK